MVWGPGKCFLEDQQGERTPLSTASGCPQLCEAEALALIAKIEDRRREKLENLVEDTGLRQRLWQWSGDGKIIFRNMLRRAQWSLEVKQLEMLVS